MDTDFSQAFIRMEILSILVGKFTFVPSVIDAARSVAGLIFEIGQKIKIWFKIELWSFDGGSDVKEQTNIGELGDFGLDKFELKIIKGLFGVQKQILKFNEIFHWFLLKYK